MNDELERREQLHLQIMKNFIPHTQFISKCKHPIVLIQKWQVQVRTTVVIVTLWLERQPICLRILICAAGNISGAVIRKGTTMPLRMSMSQ
jgi:hypothetical protein